MRTLIILSPPAREEDAVRFMNRRLRNRQLAESAPRSFIGKLFGSIFMSVFAGIGIAFIVLFLREELIDTFRVRSWTSVPCTVVSAQPVPSEDGGGKEKYAVGYTYEFGGHSYTGRHWKLKDGQPVLARNVQEVDDASGKYVIGTTSRCYVNPDQPVQAVLQRGSLAPLPFMMIPLVFIAVGLGGYLGDLEALEEPEGQSGQVGAGKKSAPLNWAAGLSDFCSSEPFLQWAARSCGVILGGPVATMIAATSWETVPCVIESSYVGGHG